MVTRRQTRIHYMYVCSGYMVSGVQVAVYLWLRHINLAIGPLTFHSFSEKPMNIFVWVCIKFSPRWLKLNGVSCFTTLDTSHPFRDEHILQIFCLDEFSFFFSSSRNVECRQIILCLQKSVLGNACHCMYMTRTQKPDLNLNCVIMFQFLQVSAEEVCATVCVCSCASSTPIMNFFGLGLWRISNVKRT